ncbi:glutamate formimidoyltransferase [Kallotenue papyrolyticum]|uniref:glutamate formimidoyltransferase n=1 Tax=Kallotenue papyrolyticum TaxID=1325125 RepID=UPI000492DC76|nr:glutamate formimidoyltransferase [Kallotenue papyrolyticum]
MPEPLIECVPNFSEGRRQEVIDQIVAAITAVPGVLLLGVDADADHHRSVVTFAGPPEAVLEGALRGIAAAQRLINLDEHRGQHPRIGAADVVPFVPLRDATLEQCVALAHRLGQRVGAELGLPVYLYEAAATRPERVNLADVRRGEYEGLKQSLGRDPARDPDYGPARLTPAGAVAIGARQPLVAYNVYLNTGDVAIARKIARAIRHSSGGLRYVKAIGLLVNGRAQVSINMTDVRSTPLQRVFELIKAEAARYGCTPTESEIVGFVPEDALLEVAEHYLQLNRFDRSRILERRLRELEAARQRGAAE